MIKRSIFAALIFALSSLQNDARADAHLSPVFGSNMVLQRDIPAKLVGWADVGEDVTVKLGEKIVGQVAGTGKEKPWTLLLPVQKAGPIPDITIIGRNRITLTNLLAGDVWVCSGQSNMNMPLIKAPQFNGVPNVARELATADRPQIRLCNVVETGEWRVCSSESVKLFSAAAYFFGREIQSRMDIPVGLIQAAANGSTAEAWIVSGGLYSRFIAPLTSMNIKGVIWYQGESNSLRASAYPELMAHLIGGWRQAWGQASSSGSGAPVEDFPFLIMQLAGFKCPSVPWCGPGSFVELRAAQQRIVETVAGTGLAVGIDIGDANSVHPTNKQEVGRRLALVALKQVYGQDVVAAGPALTDARFAPGRATLVFDPGGKDQSLVFKNSATNGFELAGADGKFVPASAQLNGNTIILIADGMTTPCSLRYAWADNPPATVFNTAGLPAAPFRKTAPAISVNDLDGKRVLVLGDSITAAGTYVKFIEYYLKKCYPEKKFELINSGRCSETTSGLSEAGHPGMRPCVHKRLAAEIAKHKPQIIMACYGMNDGIYASANEERAKAYYDGILKLANDCRAQGVEKVILLTPPVFDPRPWSTRLSKEGAAPQMNHPYEKYDEVLAGYSKWIMGLKLDGVSSIDLHTPMKNEIAMRCQKKPEFKLSPDGIHPGPLGHLVMAHAVLNGLGVDMRVEDLDVELAAVDAMIGTKK
ncbi:MAG: sialate O-acetylesterase [bacterium]